MAHSAKTIDFSKQKSLFMNLSVIVAIFYKDDTIVFGRW